jgi:Bacterial sugar transferase
MAPPEQKARELIDAQLRAAGWLIQDRDEMNLGAGLGVAVREYPLAAGPADYLLFVDRRACGVLEAKPAGKTLSASCVQRPSHCTIVTDRPEQPERRRHAKRIAAYLSRPRHNERRMVIAGLTGWAQINYPYSASIEDARAKLSYNLYYVKNFSILFDMLIILQTLRVVLWPSGAR